MPPAACWMARRRASRITGARSRSWSQKGVCSRWFWRIKARDMRKGATRRGGVGVLGDLDLPVFWDLSSEGTLALTQAATRA
jgi:hypothetical protein